jgi:hypothetical protein
MTKNQFKKLIKECVKEVISESLNENVEDAISDINAQKGQFSRFAIDYSSGSTFSNNLLALYGIGKRGPVWLTDFGDSNGDPLPKKEIIDVLTRVGLTRYISDIPHNYTSDGGFKGSHA